MKPEAERAIHTLDELIAWLATKRIIKNQAALDRLTTALKVVAENCEHDDAEHDAKVNAMAEMVAKLKMMLKSCGFTEKGINQFIQDYSDDEIEWFLRYYNTCENAIPINHPLANDMLRIQTRITRELKYDGTKIDNNNN